MDDHTDKQKNHEEKTWELYVLLVNIFQHYHNRCVDNYRVFLYFNSFLLPAATALLAYSIKDQKYELSPFITLLAVVGIIVTWKGFGLLRRISIDSKVRINQIRRTEDKLNNLPLLPFRERGAFFFSKDNNVELPAPINDEPLERPTSGLGVQAINAYQWTSWALGIAYLILSLTSIGLFNYKLYTLFRGL